MHKHNKESKDNQNGRSSGRVVAPVVTGLLAQLLPVGRKSPQKDHFWLSHYNVLRRFHNTPLGLCSYFISNGRMDLLRRSRTLSKDSTNLSSLHAHIFSNRFVRTSAVVAVFLLILLTSATLVPLYNKLEITEAATGTAKESSLSFNLTNGTASVDLSVNSGNGTFATSTTPASFNISTTNYTGYTLSIKNSKSTTTLVNSTNSSYTLSSLTGTVTPTNFSADSTTAATNYNGKWGYYPSKYNSSTNSYYRPSPTTTASTLDKTSSANTSGTVNSYTIGIGTRASYTTPAGEYTGTYILTAVGNPINYTVTYNKNTTDTVSSLPSNVSSSTSQTYITLSNDTPTRDGYTFLGWCLGTITTTNNVDSCTGTTYQPGSSFYIDQESANLPTLLAMWEKNAVNELANFTYMQDVTTTACNNTDIGQTATVKDNRDNTAYTIGKLADGNCWLLDNLALDLTNSTVLSSMSSTNTNATNTALGYLKGTTTGTTSDQYATSAVKKTWTSSYSYSDPWIAVDSSTSGLCTDATYCVDSTNKTWSSTSSTSTANGGADKYPGKLGIYYNYCAATAGSYCYGSGTSYGTPPANTNASYDICPYGWRLPTGGSSGEFQTLYGKYNDYANFRSALGVPLSGYFSSGVAYYQGSGGYFWSSTYHNASSMHFLSVNTSTVNPAGTNARHTGRSVRCVLKETVANNMYMQDATLSTVANMEVGQTVTMLDNRDNTSYKVGKLADGNLWFLENLALDLTNSTVQSKLTSATTNATDTILGYLKNGGGTSPYPASGVSSAWTSSSQDSYDLPYMVKSGKCNDTTSCTGGSAKTWSYTSTTSTANSSVDKYPGKVGVYYNYCAASAGSYCYASNSAPTNTNASYDICPYGWRLPTGGSNGEFQALYTAYGSNYANFRSAIRVPLSGAFRNGVAYDQGSGGHFWSSTYYGANGMYYLFVNASRAYLAYYTNRYHGFSVRCVFGE